MLLKTIDRILKFSFALTKNIFELHTRKITSISQDAFLFSGSVRSNLDPDNRHSDGDIKRAIEQVDLEEKVAYLGGLDGKIAEMGNNLSAGQKQLFCLAR